MMRSVKNKSTPISRKITVIRRKAGPEQSERRRSISGREWLRWIETEFPEGEGPVEADRLQFEETREKFEKLASESDDNRSISAPNSTRSSLNFEALRSSWNADSIICKDDSQILVAKSIEETVEDPEMADRGVYSSPDRGGGGEVRFLDLNDSADELRSYTGGRSSVRDILSPPSFSSFGASPTGFSSPKNTSLRGGSRFEYRSQNNSRGASPTADMVLGSTGRRKSGEGTLRTQLVEKEVIESQLRKLQMENSSLQTENKLLKDKYNRSQARVQSLENQLLHSQHEADSIQNVMDIEVTTARKKTQQQSERTQLDLEEQIIALTKQVELLKAENLSLEKQLELTKRNQDISRTASNTDRSRVFEGYRVEIANLKGELENVRSLMRQSERHREEEADKRREASEQVIKLTEMKTLLQQQLEDKGGGSVAEKQVKSLETRLKITEDRLHQERADRSGKLSETEEKLINDNAKLQISEKELKRQLQREKDKNKNLDTKYKSTREENESLRVKSGERPSCVDDMTYQKPWSSIKGSLNSRKHADDIKEVLAAVREEDGLEKGQEEDMVWLLWHRRDELARQVKEYEIALDDLGVDQSDIKGGLKTLRENHHQYEDRLQRYKDSEEDMAKNKEEIEKTLRDQIQSLVQEKHTLIAKLRNLEDLNAAVSAENDSLRGSLKMHAGHSVKAGDVHTWEAQVESLQSDLRSTRGDLQQTSRSNKQQECELESLRNTMRAKDESLEEALYELERLSSSYQGGAEADERQQHKVDKLHAENKGLQAEVKLWQEKYNTLKREESRLEQTIQDLTRKLGRSRTPDSTRVLNVSSSDKAALESEVEEKEAQVLSLTVRYNEVENEIQRTKQLLLLQQEHNEELTTQLDQVHTQLRARGRQLETMSNTDTEKQTQLQSARENVEETNKQLAATQKELKQKSLDIEHEINKSERLKEDLANKEKLLSRDFVQAITEGKVTSVLLDQPNASTTELLTQADIKCRTLQNEKENLVFDVKKANSCMDTLVQENTDLTNKLRHLNQQLAQEKALCTEFKAQKAEVLQNLHICSEERDAFQKEKALLQRDLIKHEAQTAQQLQRSEIEADNNNLHNNASHKTLVAAELGTTKRLLEAREREIELLRDTIDRQKHENDSLGRKIQVLKEEHHVSQEEKERLTGELTNKLRESTITSEASTLLSSERAKLQMEKYHMTRDMGRDKEELERKNAEVQNLQKKLEKAEDKQRDTQEKLHQLENSKVAIETELRHTKKQLTQFEDNAGQNKSMVEKLNRDIRELATVNSSLEQKLSLETNTLSEEKSKKTQMHDELSETALQVETLRREYDILQSNLQLEKTQSIQLRDEKQDHEDRVYRLEDRLKTEELEIDSLKNTVVDLKTTIEQNKKDKQSLYQDVQDLCRKVADRDETILRLQEKSHDTIETIQKDWVSEKLQLCEEKQRLQIKLDNAVDDKVELQGQLKQKEIRLETYIRDSQQSELDSDAKQDYEERISQLEKNYRDAKREYNTLTSENKRLSEHCVQLQESLDKVRDTNVNLKEELRHQRETMSRDVYEQKHALSEEIHKQETEKADITDRLNKTLAELKATEVQLAALQETKTTLSGSNRSFEKSIELLRSQLNEESTQRKLSDQKVDALKQQIDDVKSRKIGIDERTSDLETQLTRIEQELKLEKEKNRKLRKEMNDNMNSTLSNESQTHVLLVQISDLESEVSSLKNQLQTTRQDLTGKNKRMALELKQKTEDFDKDKHKMISQVNQLSMDLDHARDQCAAKNRENMKLQEQLVGSEGRLKETTYDLKTKQDNLKLELQSREQIEQRVMELELLVTKLKTRDYGNDQDAFESTRAEVSKMMAELTRRMHDQLEAQRNNDTETRERNIKKIEELKRKITTLESNLSQEQALHIVTKSTLTSVEDDNQRLRQQLQAARKRLTQTTGEPERNKSRIEEINEIIAKSQSRAQQMLASGNYLEYSTIASPRDFNFSANNNSTFSPRPGYYSDDNDLSITLNSNTDNVYRQINGTHLT